MNPSNKTEDKKENLDVKNDTKKEENKTVPIVNPSNQTENISNQSKPTDNK